MPTYVYETVPATEGARVRRFEISQRMSEPALKQDPKTGERVRRVISGGLGLVNVGGEKNAQPYYGTGACGLPECAPQQHTCTPGCDH